jgi:hypothetical protein
MFRSADVRFEFTSRTVVSNLDAGGAVKVRYWRC